MLLCIIGCSNSEGSNEPAFEVTRIDICYDGKCFNGGEQEVVEIPVDEPLVKIWVHAYNEKPICGQVMEIYDETQNLYIRSEFPVDPCLSPLTNRKTEAWTLGFEIHTLQGQYPEGKHTLYAWIKDSTGKDSPYEAVDIFFGELKNL